MPKDLGKLTDLGIKEIVQKHGKPNNSEMPYMDAQDILSPTTKK